MMESPFLLCIRCRTLTKNIVRQFGTSEKSHTLTKRLTSPPRRQAAQKPYNRYAWRQQIDRRARIIARRQLAFSILHSPFLNNEWRMKNGEWRMPIDGLRAKPASQVRRAIGLATTRTG